MYKLEIVSRHPKGYSVSEPIGVNFSRPADLIAFVRKTYDETERLEVTEFTDDEEVEVTSYEDFLDYHSSTSCNALVELSERITQHLVDFQNMADAIIVVASKCKYCDGTSKKSVKGTKTDLRRPGAIWIDEDETPLPPIDCIDIGELSDDK